ncbi:DUF1801 domain-containing protein [Pseudonocardia sp.]|jgi:hypothetical protein|uniref:DUF1801 domain-containing protein n=1 Tax=Pseudonocardia sp. TaxID=60912 RepID=UPI0031FD40FF
MRSAAVDEYVTTKVLPQHQGIVDALRDLMAECAPQAQEVILYGSPAWKGTKSLAIISPSKAHITFALERGAEFDDAHGLLDGSGKRTRHVKIRSLDELNTDALRDYIAQAVRLDAA